MSDKGPWFLQDNGELFTYVGATFEPVTGLSSTGILLSNGRLIRDSDTSVNGKCLATHPDDNPNCESTGPNRWTYKGGY